VIQIQTLILYIENKVKRNVTRLVVLVHACLYIYKHVTLINHIVINSFLFLDKELHRKLIKKLIN